MLGVCIRSSFSSAALLSLSALHTPRLELETKHMVGLVALNSTLPSRLPTVFRIRAQLREN